MPILPPLTEKRRALQPLWVALEKNLLPRWQAGSVLLAVSGGIDSRALLEAFACWKYRGNGPVIIGIVDHKTRRESTEEAFRVQARAKLLGFESVICTLANDLPYSEHVLRQERYEGLWRMCHQLDCRLICTAHHEDDDAEGFLLDLLGLGGGREGSSMGSLELGKKGMIIRPFLGVSKSQLQAALLALGVTNAFQDPCDKRGVGARAYVRQNMLPLLEAGRPSMRHRLVRKSRFNKLATHMLDQTADSLLHKESDVVHIKFRHKGDFDLTEHALGLGIRHLMPNEDMRSARPVVEQIARVLQMQALHMQERLDPQSKLITLGALQFKTYVVSGVHIKIQTSSLLLRKIKASISAK